MLKALSSSPRLLMEVDLKPAQGDRFQPTGFADLGAAVYKAPDGTRKLLVESAQSMANRLDGTILGPDHELAPELKGLSYVRAQLDGASDAKTNSLIEAHRLNSPFIIKGIQKDFVALAGYKKGRPVDWRKVARALFRYDVNSLLHGVFLANVEDGRLRVPRAITGFIEASGVAEAVSGGVKNNPIDPSGTIRAADFDKDVYGNVPYQRTEYTAERMTAFFNLDLQLLRSFDLGEAGYELLAGLALLKVRRFLDGGLRLRTACDLLPAGSVRVTMPEGFRLPGQDELLTLVQRRIQGARELFGEPAVTEVRTQVKDKKANSKKTAGSEGA